MPPHAWFLDDEKKEALSLNELEQLGVLYWKIDVDNHESDETLKKVRKDRDYTYNDIIDSKKISELEKKLSIFFDEHFHDDEEIRLFLNGSGFFDVRDERENQVKGEGRWVRIHCQKGDMLVLPAGIFHRFKPDDDVYFHVMRLFQGEPVWTAHSRSLEETSKREARANYVREFLKRNKTEDGDKKAKVQE